MSADSQVSGWIRGNEVMSLTQIHRRRKRQRMLLLCLNLVFILFYSFWRGERRENGKGRSCKRRDAKLNLLSV